MDLFSFLAVIDGSVMQHLPKVTLLTRGNDVTRISPKGLGKCFVSSNNPILDWQRVMIILILYTVALLSFFHYNLPPNNNKVTNLLNSQDTATFK